MIRWVKYFVAVVCVAVISGCASVSTTTTSPAAAQMQSIRSSFEKTALLPEMAWANYAADEPGAMPVWHFGATRGLRVSGPVHLKVVPAVDNQISLTVLNDPHLTVHGTVVGSVLALALTPQKGVPEVILAIPVMTTYVTFNQLLGLSGSMLHVQYLSLDRVRQIDVSIQGSLLEYLYLNHASHITLRDMGTPYLLSWIKNSDHISLQGQMALRELNVVQSHEVSAYWINSPLLSVHVKDAKGILLGGVAKVFNANASGDTNLDARYLRAHRVFVKTTDNAKATVVGLDVLNAMATQQSTIYYYAQPKLLSRSYWDQGSVLFMGEAPPVCMASVCPPLAVVLPG